MIERIFYTRRLMKQHAQALKAFCLKSENHSKSVTDIDINALKQCAKFIALDFDGVLAAHGKPEPSIEVQSWLQRLLQVFPENQVVILSNKPTEERRQWFASRYPGIDFIGGVRKKPYPDGLQLICQRKNTPADTVLLVDDRLLTGVLATIEAGAQAIWITEAYQDFSGGFIHESFFALLRICEKTLYLKK